MGDRNVTPGLPETPEQDGTMYEPLAHLAQDTPPALPLPWEMVPPELLATGAGTVLVAGALAGAAYRSMPGGRRAPVLPLRVRARMRMHPGPGWAGEWDRWRSLGLPSSRRVAAAARPSLTWWDRHRPGGWPRYATRVGTAWGWICPRRVFSDLEKVVLTFAPPRRGKSAAAIDSICDWDGPLVATSIKDDLVGSTIGPRSERGQVHVLNPEGLGERYGTTARLNPVSGCTDPRTAARRAGTMVEAQTSRGLSDADFWNDQVSMVLSGYLHAAALVNYSMKEVYAWADGTDDTPLQILRRAAGANPAYAGDVSNFLEKMADRTQSSVTTTLRRTLQFMRVPEVAAAVSPQPEDEFSIEDFLSGSNTLYLVSNGADSVTQPLFAMVIGEIAHLGRLQAASNPGGRLDPPLSLELDEIANTAPVPVDRWASWMGGHGMQVRIYAQSWAQLVDRYGHLTDAIWACAGTVTIFGGTVEPELLDRAHRLAGTVEVRDRDTWTYEQRSNNTTKRRRQKNYKTIDVLSASDLRMPRHWAVVLSSDVPPVVVNTPKGWRRWDVRRWRGRTPDGIVPPTHAALPEADYGLREELERGRAEAAPAPRPQTARGQGKPAQAGERQAEVEDLDAVRTRRQEALIEQARRARAEQVTGTESAGSRASGQGLQDGPPPLRSPTAPPAAAPRAQGSGADSGAPPASPPLSPGQAPKSGRAEGPRRRRLHPAPWDLPAPSRPQKPAMPWDQEGDDD